MSEEWIGLAIAQTRKVSEKLKTDNRLCLVCQSHNKGKRKPNRCTSPWDETDPPCPAMKMCRKYVKLIGIFKTKLANHIVELRNFDGT